MGDEDESATAEEPTPLVVPPLLPRPAWAAGTATAPPALSDSALAATYLRRLGYGSDEAASLVSGEPFKGAGSAPKSLLCSLVQRHVLRVPFENLEFQQAAAGSAAHQEACNQRARNIRLSVERIASGCSGGLCFDLNVAFAWLLRQLGASVRLSSACMAELGQGFSSTVNHFTVLVDLHDGTYIADPGLPDPARIAVRTDGETPDDLALYEVVALEKSEQPAAGFDKALRRTRGSNSLCRHFVNPDAPELDQAEAGPSPVFAFRQADSLSLDAPEIVNAVQAAVAPGGSPLTERRLVCLALPKGHILLTENHSRRVEGGSVVEEVKVDSEDTWLKLAGAIFGRPLVTPDLKVGRPVPTSAAQRAEAERRSSAASLGDSLTRSTDAKSKNWGTINKAGIAVGGAGAGGGMGLNAPGFGPKVQHFAGGRSSGSEKLKSINVDEEIKRAWAQVMDDGDPLGWLFCEYSADGKTLELTSKGEGGLKIFKEQLGTAMGWGGFRCCGVDKRGGLECKRPKFIFVQYKPESAPAIKKAKQGSHKGDVKDAISGAHIDIVVENGTQDLDEQALIAKLQAATGAHKPNGYEFEDGVFLEADFYGLGIGRDCKDETSKN